MSSVVIRHDVENVGPVCCECGCPKQNDPGSDTAEVIHFEASPCSSIVLVDASRVVKILQRAERVDVLLCDPLFQVYREF